MYLSERASDLFPEASFARAHCNFSLRGAESDADEDFVRKWCSDKGLTLYCRRFDTASEAESAGESIEMAARRLRYRWFAQLCSSEGFDAVAVAHNANDEAETFLLNLLRGTGTRGLKGMSPDSVVEGARVLRPMLDISRDEITSWMNSNGKSWREDSTNSDTRYKRNLLRTGVLPLFEKINPSFLSTLRSDMQHISQVDGIAEEYWQSARKAGLTSSDAKVLHLDILNSLGHPEYLTARFVEGKGFSTESIAAICKAAGEESSRGKRFESRSGWTAELSRGQIELISPEEMRGSFSLTVNAPGEYIVDGKLISIQLEDTPQKLKQSAGTLIFDERALPFPFTLRSWKQGDWLVPLGMKGRKKLSDLFTDLSYTPSQKRKAVLAVAGDGSASHVAALLGERIDDSTKVTPKTARIIRITQLQTL